MNRHTVLASSLALAALFAAAPASAGFGDRPLLRPIEIRSGAMAPRNFGRGRPSGPWRGAARSPFLRGVSPARFTPLRNVSRVLRASGIRRGLRQMTRTDSWTNYRSAEGHHATLGIERGLVSTTITSTVDDVVRAKVRVGNIRRADGGGSLAKRFAQRFDADLQGKELRLTPRESRTLERLGGKLLGR